MLNNERDRIFNNWLADHKGVLFKVVHAYAFEHADRQDLFQEIVIQVWRSVDAFRGDSSVPTWMYRVALNTAIAWTRKEGRHQRGKQPFEVAEGLLMTASADGRDPRVEWLYHQIAQLKDVDRSVALLLLDGFSYKEIAAIVGLTESNVGVKIVTPGGPGAGMVKLDKMTGEPVWMAKELSKTFCRTMSISGRLVRRIHETPNRAVLKQGDRRCG
jgi:RNA polymerase sigma-70 factor (ECF subfamily)